VQQLEGTRHVFRVMVDECKDGLHEQQEKHERQREPGQVRSIGDRHSTYSEHDAKHTITREMEVGRRCTEHWRRTEQPWDGKEQLCGSNQSKNDSRGYINTTPTIDLGKYELGVFGAVW
jgi:hypothetical protein